jgi:TolB protein
MTWSPDGRFILFQAVINYTPQIYRVDVDGTHLQQLTGGKGSFAPRVSPDGARIAFIAWRDSGAELFVMNADGIAQRQLTRDGGSKATPVWSPDGTTILIQTFFSHNLPTLLNIIDVDSGQQQGLADDAAFDVPPSWSSDGARVLFEKQIGDGSALYVIDADGQNRRLVFQNPAQPTFRAVWQPGP